MLNTSQTYFGKRCQCRICCVSFLIRLSKFTNITSLFIFKTFTTRREIRLFFVYFIVKRTGFSLQISYFFVHWWFVRHLQAFFASLYDYSKNPLVSKMYIGLAGSCPVLDSHYFLHARVYLHFLWFPHRRMTSIALQWPNKLNLLFDSLNIMLRAFFSLGRDRACRHC